MLIAPLHSSDLALSTVVSVWIKILTTSVRLPSTPSISGPGSATALCLLVSLQINHCQCLSVCLYVQVCFYKPAYWYMRMYASKGRSICACFYQ